MAVSIHAWDSAESRSLSCSESEIVYSGRLFNRNWRYISLFLHHWWSVFNFHRQYNVQKGSYWIDIYVSEEKVTIRSSLQAWLWIGWNRNGQRLNQITDNEQTDELWRRWEQIIIRQKQTLLSHGQEVARKLSWKVDERRRI